MRLPYCFLTALTVSERRQAQRAIHALGKAALLAQDKALVLRQSEVGAAFRVRAQAGTVGLVRSERVKADQPPGLVVAAFVRQEVAQQVAAAAGDDLAPSARVVGECLALKGVDLVTDEAGNHGVANSRVDKGFTIGR